MIRYRPSGATTRRFHLSGAKRRVIVGPIRSGTSVACCTELMRRIMQVPSWNGIRRSRWAVLRQTYGDLERTTLKTWNEWARPVFRSEPVKRVGGIIHDVRLTLPDGTQAEAEINFFSLNDERSLDKLLSLELTGGFINEVRQFPKVLIDAFDDRVGHFPPKHAGGEGCWFGWWADTNPPDMDHWIYETFELEEAPPGWQYFRQPGGLIRDGKGGWIANPLAENTQNLNGGASFYLDAMPGKSEAHIAVYYGGEYGYSEEGKRIISDYDDARHAADGALAFDRSNPVVYVGIDFGATPAAALLQEDAHGVWNCIEELQAEKIGVGPFAADVLAPRLYVLQEQGFEFVVTGDPSGGGTSESNGRTAFQSLAEQGIVCGPAYTNVFAHRSEVLNRLCRQDRFRLSPACKIARRGLAQKYVLKTVGTVGEGTVHQTVPDKNEFSHVVDAVIYGVMGAGEGRDIGT